MEEGVTGAFQSARTALHGDAAIHAIGRAAELRQIVEMEVDVICDHQVDISIAVVVAEGCAGRPAAIGDAGFGGDVSECAVAVVVIENVAAEASYVEIWPAIIVVVADRAAHRQARLG